jgi:hypothetical protein
MSEESLKPGNSAKIYDKRISRVYNGFSPIITTDALPGVGSTLITMHPSLVILWDVTDLILN